MASGKRIKKAGASRRTAESKRAILRERSPFMMREAYKGLRTNVTYSMPGGDAKCIAVTSANRSEGKSYNTINLAISFAQIEKKVVVIDCDMRLPTIASKLGVQAKPGLSDYLIGEAKLEEVLQRDVEGIDVIPAGNIPRDPTWLLESVQMEALLEALRKLYDYVLIDLPPVNTVTDAAILSRCTDGILLVVRHNVTAKREVAEMLRQLRFAGAKILGFVYNDVPIVGKKYGKRYYRYYRKNYGKYGYGYGYGERK